MKNMVSGRKSDRNRKNIVFGKIPEKKNGGRFFLMKSEVFKTRSEVFNGHRQVFKIHFQE